MSKGVNTHKKKCSNTNEIAVINKPFAHEHTVTNKDDAILTSLVEIVKSNSELQKQNQEFKELIVTQNKTIIEQNTKLLDICKKLNPEYNYNNQ